MRVRTFLVTGSAVLVALLTLVFSLRQTSATPTFTGDAAADFTSPTAIKLDDRSTPDVGVPQTLPTGTISGFDIRAFYLDYDAEADIMYVGIDCFNICGDADGDGDPNIAGPLLGRSVAEGGLGGVDAPDFGDGEAFGLLFDTNSDYTNGSGDFEVVVGVSPFDDLTQIGAFDYLGAIGEQLLDDTWGTRLSNTVTLFANPSANTPDLEFTIANFSTLPGFTAGEPLSYKVHLGMGSSVDDGIGEDFAPDQNNPIVITPTPEPDTPTPTATPNSPLETPTATPNNPTATPTAPPPTDVPETGAELHDISYRDFMLETGQVSSHNLLANRTQPKLSQRQLGQNELAQEHAAQSAVTAPELYRLQIPAIDLEASVVARGWDVVELADAQHISQWEDIRFAAGWHKNSAPPGAHGNTVISGHNNIYGAVFRDLWQLKPGEEIQVARGKVQYNYVIEQVKIAQETFAGPQQQAANAAYIQPTKDDRLTLVTCWPWNSSTHRLFVVAHLDGISMVDSKSP